MAFGMARNTMEADFHFVSRKVLFPFSECRNRVFYEVATETRNRKLGTTPHINNRPLGVCISALFLCVNLQRYILEFAQAPADFVGSGVSLHFSGNKISS
jgi:hypothetical protein